MLKHYAPKTPLKLNIDKPNLDDAFLDFGNKKVISHQPTLNLSKSSDLKEAHSTYFIFKKVRQMFKTKNCCCSNSK